MNKLFRFSLKNTTILILLINCLFLPTLSAQTNTFDGSTDAKWNTASNWSLDLVPTYAHDVVIPNNMDVTVNTAAVCNSFTITGGANSNAITLDSGASLTVTGAVIINAPTANGKSKEIIVKTGTLSCASITMESSTADNRDCSIIATSGTINVSGNITMNGTAARNQLSINGTPGNGGIGGTLNIGGSLSGGDFSSSNDNSTINFNGTTPQIIPINADYIFNKVYINNIAGATLGAAITTSNVTDNITVQTGILNNGGFAIAGNGTKTFTVANEATFKASGTTSAFPSGFGTNTLGATSTVEYSGSGNQTIFDVASPGYGHLTLSTGGIKTAASGLDIRGNVTVNSGLTLVVSNFTHNIGGSWLNNGTFTAGTSTINFNGTATGKTISGTITGASGFNNLTFNGVGGAWTIANNLDIANTLTITNGTIGMNGVLSVAGNSAITLASGGSLTLENNASLIQSGYTGANSGNIIVKRESTPIVANDYTYWSSPTTGVQKLLEFSPQTHTEKFLTFNNNAWIYANPSVDTFTEGLGYAICADQSISPTAPPGIVIQEFTGAPNNGNVNIDGTYGITAEEPRSFKLIGNPYPSAIDANAFIDANLTGSGIINKTITGTLYFWTHNHGLSGNNYSSSDYAIYNKTGSTSVGTSSGGGNTTNPTQYIASGQGFFVETIATGNVSFTNAMRSSNSNSNFYKSSNAKIASGEFEAHRIWLNLTNDTTSFSQALIGYVEAATNDSNPGFDGLTFGETPHALYSLIDSDLYTIQGRALPFEDHDIVPLGFRLSVSGNTTISIDHIDGLFSESQNIYLEDKLLNVTHDLKQSPYVFSSEKGTFNDRFVLKYVSTALGMDNFEEPSNIVKIAIKNKVITIKSQMETIAEVSIYDILGRQIYQNKNIQNNEISISNLMSSQALIIKTVLVNGQVINKKLVN